MGRPNFATFVDLLRTGYHATMTLASIGCQNNVVSLLGATVADVAGVCRVACSVLTTLTLIVTFYAGRYVGTFSHFSSPL